ncbi:MAG: valine--tRNA ligase [Clostridia bacterium]|nr:valine--tRNA ligase [Clostridia bacterium]
MSKEILKTYEPKSVEDKIYKFWIDNKFFSASPNPEKEPYTIVIPPPNITGQLHMGHALDQTLQDILIRYKRMCGFETLWLPGTDHASIATEAKIVEAMKEEGITKQQIGREEFLKRAWAWKEKYGGTIIQQLKKLGSSCDWDKERFTLDEGCSKAVKDVFIKLYEKGLIYQGERIINWCPHCKTSISDAEVEFKELDGSFWHLRYPIVGQEGRFIELATTRPETMLGDTAVAVHPDDERYKDLVGKKVLLPLVNKEIPIVADEYVKMDFGTGVVKITPAHDPNDFEVGLRHSLPIINIFDEGGVLNENAGKYEGLDRYEARKVILADLEKDGYLIRTEPIKHNVGSCYRCSTIVEPRVSKQWFVKMKPLADPALESVKNKEVKFVPERFEKIYNHWMENIKDWCISRQLWWGHRIPAYYCQDCGATVVSADMPSVCPKCKGSSFKQDEDTLDTWFSSALWPFSTLGWPEDTEEFKYFYPTDTLVTGYDIIFFWVARMIFSALEHTGEVPFKTVFVHGLVRDAQGRKMSKSLGNGIDPLEIIDKYGADALRFSLATGNSPGNDMRFTKEKLESSRNFANKIWNAARFIHMNIDGLDIKNELPADLKTEDKWIISELNSLISDVNENLEKFELGIAVQKIYDFAWDSFCDWYIELSKTRFIANDEGSRSAKQVLLWVFSNILKLLHPFMPFITEELWQSFPHEGDALMISSYPQYDKKNEYKEEVEAINKIMSAIKAIRNRRSEMNVAPSRKAKVFIDTEFKDIYENGKAFIEKLACASSVEVGQNFEIDKAVNIVTADAKIYIPMDELVDKQAEIKRLTKELEKAQKELDICNKKLNNQGFVAKAPENVINGVREKAEKQTARIELLKSTLSSL